MKIKNITDNKIIKNNLSFPVTLDKNRGIEIILEPGQFIYVEEQFNNMVLRVYKQKQLVSVVDEKKPSHLKYYEPYYEHDLAVKDLEIKIEESKLDVIKIDKTPLEQEKSLTQVTSEEESQNDLEIEIIVPEDALKNKGGRPKGSKNKPKKGRPGRPKKRGRKKKRK
jgi:hypothetical protein